MLDMNQIGSEKWIQMDQQQALTSYYSNVN
jgi:hypothetical protein